jgi:hypothetical protein
VYAGDYAKAAYEKALSEILEEREEQYANVVVTKVTPVLAITYRNNISLFIPHICTSKFCVLSGEKKQNLIFRQDATLNLLKVVDRITHDVDITDIVDFEQCRRAFIVGLTSPEGMFEATQRDIEESNPDEWYEENKGKHIAIIYS